LQIII